MSFVCRGIFDKVVLVVLKITITNYKIMHEKKAYIERLRYVTQYRCTKFIQHISRCLNYSNTSTICNCTKQSRAKKWSETRLCEWNSPMFMSIHFWTCLAVEKM